MALNYNNNGAQLQVMIDAQHFLHTLVCLAKIPHTHLMYKFFNRKYASKGIQMNVQSRKLSRVPCRESLIKKGWKSNNRRDAKAKFL